MSKLALLTRSALAATIAITAAGSLACLPGFYLEAMARYPLYGLLYLVLALVAFGLFGRGFGLSNLLWHEDRRTQFISGLGVGLITLMMSTITFEILRDHDNDHLMSSMRAFRDSAPIVRLAGPRGWEVDPWELNRWLDGAYKVAPAIRAGGGEAAHGKAQAGRLDDPTLRYEEYKKYREAHPAEIRLTNQIAMRNRTLLYFLSVPLPWIAVLCLPAISRGTRLRPGRMGGRRSGAGPLALGAAGGWAFVAGSAVVALAALDASYWLPYPVLWVMRHSWFYYIPQQNEQLGGIWSWMHTNPRLFVQIMVSQVTFGLFLVALLFWFRRRGPYDRVTPPTSICLILALFTLAYGVLAHLAFLHPMIQAGAAVAIGALVLSQNRGAFKLRFPFMEIGEGGESYYGGAHRVDIRQFYDEVTGEGPHALASKDRAPEASGSAPVAGRDGLLDSQAVLDRWKAVAPGSARGEKPVIALVATSGGSIRAAAWTAKVLTKLEKEIPEFPYHLRLVTGASGGMLGAALYVADLDEPDRDSPSWPGRPDSRRLGAIGGLPKDSLSAVARCLALRDLPGMFCRGPLPTDRGRALEEVWEESHGALATPFRDLAAGEAAGWRPSLVFSPMLVEDGRRLLISNLDLEHLTVNVGSFLLDRPSRRLPSSAKKHRTEDIYSLSAYEFFRLFPEARSFRLSTAVRMSATFPFVSPAVSLPTHPPRRVVDAGYYDNYGVNSAAMWVLHHREWLLENTAGVVLIQVRAFDSPRDIHPADRPAEKNDQSDRSWRNGLRFVTSPLRGLAQARHAVMSFRNDEQLEVVSDWFNDHSRQDGFFQCVSFECPASASLSWHITEAEHREILGSFEPNGGGDEDPARINHERLKALKSWWSSRSSKAPDRAPAPSVEQPSNPARAAQLSEMTSS